MQTTEVSTGTVGGNSTIVTEIVDGDAGTVIRSGNGSDRVNAGGGNDTVFGGAGNDLVLGEDGDDFVSGGAGDDLVGGGNGDDMLVGGAGENQLLGGEGADVFVFTTETQNDLVIDYTPGEDILAFQLPEGDEREITRATFEAIATQDGDDLVLNLGAENSVTILDTMIEDVTFALL